ncbi:MAG: DUF1365 domain-containing protein [Acidithiobacillus sp.]|nr:DUF1365 domain-containing protein [Acidithiobacillus sp.]
MSAQLLESLVIHRRMQPRRRPFRYGGFHLCFDLRDQPDLEKTLSGFCPIRFRSQDHGPRDGSPLGPWIGKIFGEQGIPATRTVLICYPRLWGYVFNPVSFWLGLDDQGAILGVLAEVNNTFGEHHSYIIAKADRSAIGPHDWLEAKKIFHVSPFFPVQGFYRFRFLLDSKKFRADIHYFNEQKQLLLVTQLAGVRKTLDKSAAWAMVLRYPMLTFAVIWRIHWQALKLWRARIPFHSKPLPPTQEISS